jgi:hypothetical protein
MGCRPIAGIAVRRRSQRAWREAADWRYPLNSVRSRQAIAAGAAALELAADWSGAARPQWLVQEGRWVGRNA